MKDEFRERATAKKMRVMFPNGDVICYSNAKATFIEVLKKINHLPFEEVNIEICYLRLLSKEVYQKYKKDMVAIGKGWYVNTRSSLYNKIAQLKILSEQFNLGLIIEASKDFKGERVTRGEQKFVFFQVIFPDGEAIGGESIQETFIQCIWKIGVKKLKNYIWNSVESNLLDQPINTKNKFK